MPYGGGGVAERDLSGPGPEPCGRAALGTIKFIFRFTWQYLAQFFPLGWWCGGREGCEWELSRPLALPSAGMLPKHSIPSVFYCDLTSGTNACGINSPA